MKRVEKPHLSQNSALAEVLIEVQAASSDGHWMTQCTHSDKSLFALKNIQRRLFIVLIFLLRVLHYSRLIIKALASPLFRLQFL